MCSFTFRRWSVRRASVGVVLDRDDNRTWLLLRQAHGGAVFNPLLVDDPEAEWATVET